MVDMRAVKALFILEKYRVLFQARWEIFHYIITGIWYYDFDNYQNYFIKNHV